MKSGDSCDLPVNIYIYICIYIYMCVCVCTQFNRCQFDGSWKLECTQYTVMSESGLLRLRMMGKE